MSTTIDTKRITTPFGATSTVRNVLDKIDPSVKRLIPTGASSGTEPATVRAPTLAGAGGTLARRDTNAGACAATALDDAGPTWQDAEWQ